MAAFVERLQGLRGVVGFLLALMLGALGVLAHAPFHIWPAFGLSIMGLLILLDAAAARPWPLWAGFKVAWTWGFGYFLAGMFWVGNAFLVDAEKFAALMPLAVTALPAGLAVFWGVAGAIYARFRGPGLSRLLLFGIVISVMEYARGHMFTGLPWNLPAYIWKPGGVISQMGALVGPYGLTSLTVLLLATPALFLDKQITSKARSLLAFGLALPVIAMVVFGAVRLNEAGAIDPMKGTGPMIAAGQAGFSQKEVWDPANAMRVTQTYLDMMDDPRAQKADIILWPEGAFPFLLMEQPDILQVISDKLGSRTLVVGGIRRAPGPQGDIYSNSALVFDKSDGALGLRGSYDKHHLVPFGEYLPLRPIFKALGIASLVAYDGEMTPNPSPGLLAVRGAPIADPRVCYEIIFPSFNPAARGRAGWILNISIDAWYGDLLGPDQHYAQARARAIETGMPLVRAASGGWSAIVDRYGRPLSEHRFGAGYVSGRLPLDVKATIYSIYGDRIFALFLAFLLISWFFLHHRKLTL